jgi:DNA repair exonuclease SbcCD ATPase subunit
MSKTSSFVEQFVAFVKGDDAKVEAAKAERQATSALKGEIANLEGELVDAEQNVVDAQEAIKIARVNGGKLISNRKAYAKTLIESRNALTEAEELLEQKEETIKFLKAELKAIEG